MRITNKAQGFYSAKYLLLLAMLFMTLLLAGTVVAGKIVRIGTFTLPASTLLFICSYALSDIITEVYGYAIMRQLIWFSVICGYLFALAIQLMIKLPSPNYWHFQNEFNTVFHITFLFTTIASIAMILSIFLNSFALSKWKILMRGKHFWLRSLSASFVGELVHVVILYPIVFWSTVPMQAMPILMLSGLIYRVSGSFLITTPTAIVAIFLKRAENLDTYDYHTNFNPFILKEKSLGV